ncbi:MAG: cytochrome c-type biogenesis protein CcmH [Candidatus Lambdaproteobacteria bacterium]|nr:cytochrome c-type biogenesis protein CcmH [Candidatus Lambdaproteobacteria bacterium]
MSAPAGAMSRLPARVAVARWRIARWALARWIGALAIAIAGMLLAAGTLRALSAEQIEARVLAITDGLRCPTCQGISVKDSEAGFSQQIREKVRRMVIEGQSDEDIRAYFVSRYGEWILRAPKKEGIGLVLWILPGAALLVAGGLVFWRIRRAGRGRPQADAAAPEPELSPEQRARIARDLKRFEDEELA